MLRCITVMRMCLIIMKIMSKVLMVLKLDFLKTKQNLFSYFRQNLSSFARFTPLLHM